ncbi:MAG: iron-sulfur cluster assembly accessory protein [Candidatus Binatia bacterium]
MAITMSEKAAAKIRGLLADRNQPEAGLRLKVVGGGCSGLQYKMDLDVERPGDKVFGTPDAKILVDRKSFLYLNGTELDYNEGLMQSGFSLHNPNVKRSCGCGASFTV